jgi:hypothetical protein
MASVAIVDLDALGSDQTTYPFTLSVSGNAAATYIIGGGGRATSTGRTLVAIRCDGVNVPIIEDTTIDISTTSNAIGMGVIRAADLPVPTNTALAIEIEFSGAMIRCGAGVAQTLDAINPTPHATSHDEEAAGVTANANVTMDLSLNVPEGGIVVAFAFTSAGGGASDWTTFTGITEDIAEVDVESSANVLTGGSASNVSAAAPRTVSLVADPGPGVFVVGPCAVAASFAPAAAGSARSHGIVIG